MTKEYQGPVSAIDYLSKDLPDLTDADFAPV